MPGGANGNHDDCIPCKDGQASPDGVECKTCPPGQLPRDDHTACEVAAVYGGDDTEEEDSGVTAVVTAFATSGKGYQDYATYRVALKVTAKDAKNVFSIYGANTDGSKHHMQIPAAKQIESDSIMVVGGVNPSRFGTNPNAKFDSWLTVGVTDGKLNTVSSVGIDFSEWTETQGIDVVQGSVFWLDVNSGPTIDRDVVIAQLTVPKGAYFTGVVNAQGQTKAGSKKKVWDKRAITFHGGPVQQTGTNAAKKCKADSDCTTLKNLCKATLDAKCVKKKGKEKDKDAQGQCQCHAKRGDNTKLIPKPKPSSKNTAPTPPSPSPKTDSGGGWTGIVVFILLLAIVGGVGFAYNKGLLPPAVAGALDGVLKKQAAGGAVGDGIYNKTVGDNDL